MWRAERGGERQQRDQVVRPGPSMYRLLPSLSDYQGLHLESADVIRLMRWQRDGTEADRPARLRATWLGERKWAKSEFPSGRAGAPVLSRRLAESMGEGLAAAGSLVLVDIDAAVKDDEYFLFVVEAVVDCLDLRRSSKPKKIDGEVKEGGLPSGSLAVASAGLPPAAVSRRRPMERLGGRPAGRPHGRPDREAPDLVRGSGHEAAPRSLGYLTRQQRGLALTAAGSLRGH